MQPRLPCHHPRLYGSRLHLGPALLQCLPDGDPVHRPRRGQQLRHRRRNPKLGPGLCPKGHTDHRSLPLERRDPRDNDDDDEYIPSDNNTACDHHSIVICQDISERGLLHYRTTGFDDRADDSDTIDRVHHQLHLRSTTVDLVDVEALHYIGLDDRCASVGDDLLDVVCPHHGDDLHFDRDGRLGAGRG